ncbi:unnamed protein product [Rangifer tarandus platyrhynchus]|uniref:Uncharacterized protein n=1 Tax=Rangifer tarandus platyrhynchus TaxID=3082113 RepID=A0AC60A5P7_RANTA
MEEPDRCPPRRRPAPGIPCSARDMPPTGEGANRPSQMQKEQWAWLKDAVCWGEEMQIFQDGGNSNCFPLLRKAHQRSLVDFGEEQPPASRKSDGAQFPDCAAVDPGECPPRPEGHGPRSPTKAPPCYPTLPKWVRCPRAVLAVGIHRSSGAGEGAAGGSRVSAVAHTLGQRVFPRLRIWNSAGQRGLAPPAARDRPRALPVRARKAGLLTFVTILPLTLSTD